MNDVVCEVCGGRASACSILGHSPLSDRTVWLASPFEMSRLTEADLDRAQSWRTSPRRYPRLLREAFPSDFAENAMGIAGPVVIQTKRGPLLGTIACAMVLFVALAGVGVILAWRG